jgi:hypothetical protein
MKRFALLGLVALAATGVLVGAAAATPGSDSPHRVPLNNTPFDVGPQVCGFTIHVGIVADNEYFTHQETLPDGTLIQQVNGRLVESFTNTDTGKTIVENLSGPGVFTTFPDGSFLVDGTGLNAQFFGPIGQANTGEPGFVLSSGHLVVHFSGVTGAADSFELSGTQTNGCALLAP